MDSDIEYNGTIFVCDGRLPGGEGINIPLFSSPRPLNATDRRARPPLHKPQGTERTWLIRTGRAQAAQIRKLGDNSSKTWGFQKLRGHFTRSVHELWGGLGVFDKLVPLGGRRLDGA